jgi:hypothetical protein
MTWVYPDREAEDAQPPSAREPASLTIVWVSRVGRTCVTAWRPGPLMVATINAPPARLVPHGLRASANCRHTPTGRNVTCRTTHFEMAREWDRLAEERERHLKEISEDP